MQNKVCSCFGHRDANNFSHDNLNNILERLIVEDGVNVFLNGNRGAFDSWCSICLFLLKHKYPHIQRILVEPYPTRALEKKLKNNDLLFDSITIPEASANAHHKAAIPIRNRWMVDNSDVIIAFIEHEKGGAYDAIKYAEKKQKQVIYLEPCIYQPSPIKIKPNLCIMD